MPSPHVTFVIATYKRIEALRATLLSVVLQEYQDWSAIVVGDCCGEETAETIRSLGEPRISYYNFPKRFGEQSGPNSFGLHVATGDFLGFLNHDDLLLQDHLSYALEQVNTGEADFFIGSCANATELEIAENNRVIPVFPKVLPQYADVSYSVLEDPWLFDPSSFWLVRTAYAKRVGAWKPARDLWRSPLRDWLMRAWRLGGRFTFGNRVTGLRFWTQNLRKGSPLYSNVTPEHAFMIEFLRTHSADEVRQFIGQEVAHFPGAGKRKNDRRMQIAAKLYLKLGIDPYTLKCRLQRRPRGVLLDWITKKRTGECLQGSWDMRDLYLNPETYRVL